MVLRGEADVARDKRSLGAASQARVQDKMSALLCTGIASSLSRKTAPIVADLARFHNVAAIGGKPNPYKGAASECTGAASYTSLRQSCG